MIKEWIEEFWKQSLKEEEKLEDQGQDSWIGFKKIYDSYGLNGGDGDIE